MVETFEQKFEQHTDDVIDVTELLEELNDREGQYVWKKYAVEQIQITNPTFSFVTPRTDAVWGITSTSFDPYKVDESFFDGFTFDQTYNSQTTTQQLIYMDGELYGTGGIFESNYPRISYDPKTASFTSEHTLSASVRTLSNGKFVGQKDYVKVNEFLGYVVADDENSYPNGGLQEGYYYEIYKKLPTQSKTVTPVPEGMTVTPDVGYLLEKVVLNGFSEGVSGIDYGEVTVSYAQTITVQHNLKATPKKVILVAKENADAAIFLVVQSSTAITKVQYTDYYAIGGKGDGLSLAKYSQDWAAYTSSQITFKNTSNVALGYNGTYIWIAVA